MITPCIKLCQIDKTNNLCLGCKRTLEEISKWIYLTDIEKITIMKELEKR